MITHADCQRVSEQVGTELDVEGSGSRSLHSGSFLAWVNEEAEWGERLREIIGRVVKLQTKETCRRLAEFSRSLDEFDGQLLTVVQKNGKTTRIPLLVVSKANLDVDF